MLVSRCLHAADAGRARANLLYMWEQWEHWEQHTYIGRFPPFSCSHSPRIKWEQVGTPRHGPPCPRVPVMYCDGLPCRSPVDGPTCSQGTEARDFPSRKSDTRISQRMRCTRARPRRQAAPSRPLLRTTQPAWRAITRDTAAAVHWPPLGVLIPSSVRRAAICRRLHPSACMARTIGATSTAYTSA